jgi:putative resolvase
MTVNCSVCMKLSVWAKQQGISYHTAWRWWNTGKLLVEIEQIPAGALIVKEHKSTPGSVALYVRV